MVPNFDRLIEALLRERAEFVLVGGLALVIQGSGRTTRDLDISYGRSAENLRSIVRALAPFRPRLRGAPEGLPFLWDEKTLKSGLNFTLTTEEGDIDLLGDMSGIGGFEEALALSEAVTVYGHSIRVLSLEGLSRAKRAAGRIKDLLDLDEIELIRKRREGR